MMPVPFGFSVGDCISICLLIKDTIKALDSAHGSASEYQAVTRELSTLDRALLEVLNLQENAEFGYTRELIALGLTVKSAVEGCRECLEGFLGRIGRYERTLGNGIDGSDSKGGFGEEYDTDDKGKRAVKYNWRVAKAKVTWALGKSPDLAKFRAEINAHCSTINMLLLTANLSVTKLKGDDVQYCLNVSRRASEEKSNQQLVLLGQMKNMLDEHTRTLEGTKSTTGRLIDNMKYFISLGKELKVLMTRLWTIFLELQTRVPPGIGLCWIQEPLILTDALGRVAPIHLELINSWNALEAVLEARFHNVPGERKIKRREYALLDRSSHVDIERSASFESCFFPGRTVDMAMVFKGRSASGATCPGCGLESGREKTMAAKCNRCGIWFQRFEELIEHHFEPTVYPTSTVLTTPKPQSTSETQIREHLLERPKTEAITKKRKQDTVDFDDDLTLFKRVRLVQPKYINSKKSRPSIGQTQHSSMLKSRRLFEWLDNNVGWEKAQEEKRQRKLFSYLLETKGVLQLAALNGDKDIVQNLLSHGEDINEVNGVLADNCYRQFRCTALHAAIEGEHEDLVEYLLTMGADPNINLDFWGTPLVIAARKHNTEIAETLIRHGADVDKISVYQTINALQRASYDGDLAMVNLLLKYGANANAPSGHFGPPLVAAAMNDNVELIERLLDARESADINSQHYYDQNHHYDYRRQQSALTRAISYGHRKVVQKLLDRGADIVAESECGNAVQNAAYFGREEILDDLISRGGDIYRSTQSFANALEAAAAGAEERMFYKLVALGMDIHVKCTSLDNLLQVTARSGEDMILTYLLDHGIDVNVQGGVYVTALIAAARHGNCSTCRVLIERGADLSVQRGGRGCALHAAVEYSHLETVQVLLDAGAQINTIGGPYGTVLQLAALNTSEPVVHLLLDRGADVNIHAGYFGNALQAWSYIGNEAIVRVLLEKGADPNAHCGFYETALIAAIHERHERIVNFLVSYGAKIDFVTTSFGTASSYASCLMHQSTSPEETDVYGRIIHVLMNNKHNIGRCP